MLETFKLKNSKWSWKVRPEVWIIFDCLKSTYCLETFPTSNCILQLKWKLSILSHWKATKKHIIYFGLQPWLVKGPQMPNSICRRQFLMIRFWPHRINTKITASINPDKPPFEVVSKINVGNACKGFM